MSKGLYLVTIPDPDGELLAEGGEEVETVYVVASSLKDVAAAFEYTSEIRLLHRKVVML